MDFSIFRFLFGLANKKRATKSTIAEKIIIAITVSSFVKIFFNSEKKGNVRDYADISQLVCLSNLENLNALFISENIQQEERLLKLNRIAIQQMKLLTDDWRVKKLGIKK